MREWKPLVGAIFGLILAASVARSAPGHQNVASAAEAVEASPSAAGDWVPYGTTYVWSTDFSDVEGLRSRLQYLHSLGVRTVIQMHGPTTPLSERRRFLDEADALNMRVIVRLSGTTSDAPWGWDGENFDLSPLETFIGEGIEDHPALLAIYGFHIPWEYEGLTPADIQHFYTEFHDVAGDIPLYHDLVWVNETPDSALLPGMCDLCEISSMPHTWLDGAPANSTPHVTEKIVRYTSHIRQSDPGAQIWIQAQTFQWSPANFRMPTASDMLWHADLLWEHVDFDGLLWNPYLHGYEHQLGDEDMEAQRQAVHTVYTQHYWEPVAWAYLPFLSR
ncbi:MAG: hypothetical protein PVH50_08360 [Anaerolineae bacterium]